MMLTRNDSSDQRRLVRPTMSPTLESAQGVAGTDRQSREAMQESAASQLPSISLPKGGGAIRGIGEKFTANPVTGTGSMTVPIATSPGRSGFGPQLSLAYDSGSGNGPFGFGWSLSLPSITRKTDKGLPQYQDAEESDVYILSGAEDLVPAFKKDADGNLIYDVEGNPTIDENERDGFTIRRYRPRIEGLFARIERWTKNGSEEIHWRSISRDNITTLYGKTAESRIFDPDDSTRVFSWLICQSYDDKGNAIIYKYKEEDSKGVDVSQVHEKNRTDKSRKASRYLKRIKYGNLKPNRDENWKATDPAQFNDWMFEVVFDYGEHDPDNPTPNDAGEWLCRHDPFSSYRAGFEVRTYRLCQRVLMFHHFPNEENVGANCLVRSTDFVYRNIRNKPDDLKKGHPIASFIASVTQNGYKRTAQGGGYLKKSLPPLEFEYTEAKICQDVREIDNESLENLPYGVDGSIYQWVDLDGEGASDILTEQADAWFYKRNLSPNHLVSENGTTRTAARFGPVELVATKPAATLAGHAQFMDLAGDGQVDLVQMDGPVRGFYERTDDAGWESFRPFESWPNVDTRDPNLRFVDLDGDGHSDIIITENEIFTWYPSLAEKGFGPAQQVCNPFDEEQGPRLVFADGTQSIYLADLSGDGLTDLARIRNGEVCYWPNLGYGRFGAKVTMDNAPWFDYPDQFNQQRIRLADIDGSGTTDIIYLGRDRIDIYRNEAGNSWSDPESLTNFPRVDNLSTVMAVDLLGNGTACLVWSSPLPGEARRPMRYIDLMGGQKPHLLISTKNNLGAETRVHYAPSTKFYLDDKASGKPWITRLPFPVHVVKRVETYDYISRNRFVTRYTYHHGYFDGVEREFRGFGMVEQWDTEEFAALSNGADFPTGDNIDKTSHVPPVLTKTWFHTGVYLGRDRVSRFFAGLQDTSDRGEYYREPAWRDDDDEAKKRLLEDTILPDKLTVEEEREACRALKGSMLRQEVYALDGTVKAQHPYTVSEQNFTIRHLQPQADNRYAVFFTYAREAISYHYERNPADPRIGHALTLEVDDFGNVLKSLSIGYGRRQGQSPLQGDDQKKQEQTLITYTENDVTNPIDDSAVYPDDYRTPLPCETRTYEVTGFALAANAVRFGFDEFANNNFQALLALPEIDYEQPTDYTKKQKRLIECVRTLYRKDDLSGQLGKCALEPMALPGEIYRLAFTAGLLDQVYVRDGQKLLPANPADLLEGGGADRGGYVDLDGDGYWWIPVGRVFHSPDASDTAAQELAYAHQHFFLSHRYHDPFGQITTVAFDAYNLLMLETRDPLDNRVTVGERLPNGNLDPAKPGNDYRVLQPKLITDPNGNRSTAAFDALGMVAGTAVMGKNTENKGDSLTGFNADLLQSEIDAFFIAPKGPFSITLLGNATSRIIYEMNRFAASGTPAFAVTLSRETHVSDPLPAGGLKIQIGFGYSDGFGREIQKKIQAEPGPVNGVQTDPRWVGSGWTIFNNKGKPVKQYEPFFSNTHDFEFGKQVGVSPTLFYDPLERVVATLHPNHTYEKVSFDPWRQETWDVNDTVLQADPKNDPDAGDFFRRLPAAEYLPTWHTQRVAGTLGNEEQGAANKAAAHANTPAVAHFDALGRTFLTIADNAAAGKYATRVVLDIEGNQREVIDAKDCVVMRYDYNMLGNRIHQGNMEAGERWMLNDVAGKPIRAWDSRGFMRRMTYDALRRPTGLFVDDGQSEKFAEKTEYGEAQGSALNHRGKVYQQFDGAGVVTNHEFDFKGNLLRGSRQLLENYKDQVDWSQNPTLENETFTSSTTYDALNRPVTLTTPHTPTMLPSVIRPVYNEANLLERVDANLRGEQENGQPKWTLFVTNIDYNAKGQRELFEYGNGVTTTYEYDPLTFRLTNLKTERTTDKLQDLHYIYDPVGNITSIRDDAQQTIYFNNQVVTPNSEYLYDAIYRLIGADGREHIGQQAQPETTWNDEFRVNLPHPHDGNAMQRYTEQYAYDEVGNILSMIHKLGNLPLPGQTVWRRDYTFNEISLLDAAKKNNRLTNTTVGASVEAYTHDAHGNMTSMPHLQQMAWDFEDQLQMVDLGGGGKAYYVYDAGGQRVRKVWDKAPGLKEERIYLGGFEVFRKRDGSSAITLERETLHIMDDKQRIVLVETRTIDTAGNDTAPPQLIRYQHSNHLGSASLELDDQAQIISYEEYTPYGSTSYQAVRSQTETPKRYRYTGKERDEESGLYYHGARYDATWLGRWISTDPAGLGDGTNLYAYVRNTPSINADPTGTKCDPTMQSCIDPTVPTPYEELLQQSIPEEHPPISITPAPQMVPGPYAEQPRIGFTATPGQPSPPGMPPSPYSQQPRIGFTATPGQPLPPGTPPSPYSQQPRIGFTATPGQPPLPGTPPSPYTEQPRIGFGRQPSQPTGGGVGLLVLVMLLKPAIDNFIDFLKGGLRLDPEARLRHGDVLHITREDVQAAEAQRAGREYNQFVQRFAESQGISESEARRRLEEAARRGPLYPTIGPAR